MKLYLIIASAIAFTIGFIMGDWMAWATGAVGFMVYYFDEFRRLLKRREAGDE